MNQPAAETPLLDLLRGVPEDGQTWYEHGPMHHQGIPYGSLCKRAADELEQKDERIKQLESWVIEARNTVQQRQTQE